MEVQALKEKIHRMQEIVHVTLHFHPQLVVLQLKFKKLIREYFNIHPSKYYRRDDSISETNQLG